MNIKDLKIGWRLLIKEPSYSAIVIAGLSLGIAACFLLLGLVRHQMSFDAHVPDNEKIFLLKEHWDSEGFYGWRGSSSYQSHRAIVDSGLPVLSTAIGHETVDMRVGETVHQINVALVAGEFAKVFSVTGVKGDLNAALVRPDALALTEQTAQKLFGNHDALGKTVLVLGKAYSVQAILPTPRVTSSIEYQALTGMQTRLLDDDRRQNRLENWGAVGFGVYVKTVGQVAPEQIVARVDSELEKSKLYREFIQPMMQQSGKKKIITHQMLPLREQNLDPDLAAGMTQDSRILSGLAIVALLILALAASNYVNLAQVRAIRRQREIALQKILGATAMRVTMQFLCESALVTLVAAVIGLGLAWLVLPLFSEFLGIDLAESFSLASVGVSLLLALILGLISGLVPAYSAFKVMPNVALGGRGDQESISGQKVRRVLTVLQMSAALALSASALAVSWQSYFLSNQSIGFDPKPLISLSLPAGTSLDQFNAFYAELKQVPNVVQVGVSTTQARSLENADAIDRKGYPSIHMKYQKVTVEFFSTLGILPKAGRSFDASSDTRDAKHGVVLNENAVKKLGFTSNEDAVGQFVQRGEQEFQIIGVVSNFRNTDPKKTDEAVIYFFNQAGSKFIVRTLVDTSKVQAAIEQLWARHFPDALLRMQTVNAEIEEENRAEKNMAWLLTMASILSLAIAAFGIYVLAAYSVQRRSKEIVLRKLYGANNGHILRFVGREFAILMGLACVIALPLAYRYIQVYLADYVVHAPIGVWTLVASSVIGILVAVLATLGNTLRAVSMSPLQILRG
jgi:putative ABC transport system permease protein